MQKYQAYCCFRIWLCSALLAVQCLFGPGNVSGQTTPLLSRLNGLTDNEVYCLAQDDWGMIWAGTQNGLNRFDGYVNKAFTTQTSGLPGNVIRDIIPFRKDYLLVSTHGGLVVLNTVRETMETIRVPDDSPLGFYRNNFEKSIPIAGGRVIAYSQLGVYVFDADWNITARMESGFTANDIGVRRPYFGLRMDAFTNGDVLLATTAGYFIYVHTSNTFVPIAQCSLSEYLPLQQLIAGHRHSYIFNIDKQDRLFLVDNKQATNDTLYIFDKQNSRVHTHRLPFLPREKVRWDGAFGFHDHNRVTLPCTMGGYYGFSLDSSTRQWKEPPKLHMEDVICRQVLMNRIDSSLMTAGVGGLYVQRLQREGLQYQYLNTGSMQNGEALIYHAFPAAKGFYYAAHSSWGGISFLNPARQEPVKHIRTSFNGKRSLVYEISRWNRDTLLLATEQGLVLMQESNQRSWPFNRQFPFPKTVKGRVLAMLKSAEMLWVCLGEREGVWQHNLHTGKTVHFPNGHGSSFLSLRSCQDILRDDYGHTWFLHYADGLTRYHAGKRVFDTVLRSISPVPGKSYPIAGIAPAGNGNLWAFLNGYGLVLLQMKNGRVLTVLQLSDRANNYCNPLAVDAQGKVIISLMHSLHVFHPHTGQVNTIHNPQEEERFQNQFKRPVIAANSDFVLTGYSNVLLAWHYPKMRQAPIVPVTYITGVSTLPDSASIDFPGDISLPYDRNDLLIRFASPDFSTGIAHHYEYRLNRDSLWIATGTQPFVLLSSLSPGKYYFTVRRWSPNPNANHPETNLSFSILRPWYSSTWFLGVVLIFISVMFYAIYSYRRRHRQKLALLRANISADLHDAIGSRLTNIRFLHQMVSNASDYRKASGLLEKMNEELEDSSAMLHQMVWSMRHHDTTLADLEAICRREANEWMELTGGQAMLYTDLKKLHRRMKRDYFQDMVFIVKELLTNVKKHASASQVDIMLSQEGKVLKLTVTDNGEGFDIDKPTSRNGMQILNKRIAQWKGQWQLTSSPGQGTRVEVFTRPAYISPLKVIFRSRGSE